MSKIVKLNQIIILNVGNKELTAKKMFNRVLENFIGTHTGFVFNLLETIILSGIIIEAIIKNRLKIINPTLILEHIDPISIALVSGKKKKLINGCQSEMSDIKSAPITVLLDRFSKFYDSKRYMTGLQNYFTLRNKIVHSTENVSLEENKIAILLTKSVFPFIKEYIEAEEQNWLEIEKISNVAYDQYKTNLVREIFRHRKEAARIPTTRSKELAATSLKIEGNECVAARNLTCPACNNQSMDIIIGVDVEYEGPGEHSTYPYTYIKCRICNLTLEKSDAGEIIDNSNCYFSPTPEQLTEWEDALFWNSDVYDNI